MPDNHEETPLVLFRRLARCLVRREHLRGELRDLSDEIDDLAAELSDFAGPSPIEVDGYTIVLEPTEDTPVASLAVIRYAGALSWPKRDDTEDEDDGSSKRFYVKYDSQTGTGYKWDVYDREGYGDTYPVDWFQSEKSANRACEMMNDGSY